MDNGPTAPFENNATQRTCREPLPFCASRRNSWVCLFWLLAVLPQHESVKGLYSTVVRASDTALQRPRLSGHPHTARTSCLRDLFGCEAMFVSAGLFEAWVSPSLTTCNSMCKLVSRAWTIGTGEA